MKELSLEEIAVQIVAGLTPYSPDEVQNAVDDPEDNSSVATDYEFVLLYLRQAVETVR